MITLSAIARREKNKLSTGSAFIILLDINLPNIVRICYNTEDVMWRGNLYQAFPFELGEVTETYQDEEPHVELKVSNVSQALQYYVEDGLGGNGTEVIIRVVNSENLDSDEAELEEYFVVQSCSVNEQEITFTLGGEYSARTRRPLNRYMKNNCPFKYKGIRCGYNGDIENCQHTLTDCRAHGNSKRFGGFQGVDQKGVYIN